VFDQRCRHKYYVLDTNVYSKTRRFQDNVEEIISTRGSQHEEDIVETLEEREVTRKHLSKFINIIKSFEHQSAFDQYHQPNA